MLFFLFFNKALKEGFKVFTVHGKKCAEGVLSHNRGTQTIWAQDIWTLLPTNMLFKNKSEHTMAILSRFNLVPNKTQNDLREFEGCCVSLKENIEQKDEEIKDYIDYQIECHKGFRRTSRKILRQIIYVFSSHKLQNNSVFKNGYFFISVNFVLGLYFSAGHV